jgi:hypothetical protein
MLTTQVFARDQILAVARRKSTRRADAAPLKILDLLAAGGILETTRPLADRRYALRIGGDIPITGRISRCQPQRLEPTEDGYRTVFRADLVFDPPSSAVWAQLLAFAEALELADLERPLPIALVDAPDGEP